MDEKEFNKAEEYLNGWKRSQADFINYKKDEIKRFEEILKFGNENLIREILPVLDSLTLAKEVPIRHQFEDILKRNGLEEVVVKISDRFDPKFHEAIVEVESDQPSGAIVEEIEKGYTLHGKLIRPVKVKVSK